MKNSELFKRLFNVYDKVNFFPSPEYKKVLDKKMGEVNNLKWISEERMFEDFENVTYFYNFSKQNIGNILDLGFDERMKRLGLFTEDYKSDRDVKRDTKGTILYRCGWTTEQTIGGKLKELLSKGNNVTHFVCTEETYGGDDYFSVWRTHEKADIYEVKK